MEATMRSKKLFQILAMAVALIFIGAAGVMAQGTASTPTSDGGITPYIIEPAEPGKPGSEGGNRDCDDVAAAFDTTFEESTGKIDYPTGGDNPEPVFEDNFFPFFEVTVIDGTYVSWKPVVGEWKGEGNGLWIPCNVAVIVKGSDDANIYYYPTIMEDGDSGLASPPAGGSGGPAGLSNLTFCFNLCPVEEPPVCIECDDETAWAYGEPYNPTEYGKKGNWAMYVSYFDLDESGCVPLVAGQNEIAGQVCFSEVKDGEVEITITLNDGWKFYEDPDEENVKIQDYNDAPSGNPAPGLFDHKFNAPGDMPFVVPANNFYGVHADLEFCWDVICPE
jgi:hypothetical protein